MILKINVIMDQTATFPLLQTLSFYGLATHMLFKHNL